MWSVVFCLFGICWVIPQRVVDLLDSWSCNFRRHHNIAIWRIVPHYLMWCIWQERNNRSFEGCERSILQFKSFYFFTLLEWCLVSPSFSCLSLPILLDHCNLVSWCFYPFSTCPIYWAVFFFLIKFLCYLSKKKKNSKMISIWIFYLKNHFKLQIQIITNIHLNLAYTSKQISTWSAELCSST